MIALGQLSGLGRHDGNVVAPEDWVDASTSAEVGAYGYTYQWWVLDAGGYHALAGFGSAGQLVEVVPHLNLVVVVSAVVDPAAFDPDAIG